MNAPTIKSNLPRFDMLVAMKLLLELPTIAELNDFFNCKVIECNGVERPTKRAFASVDFFTANYYKTTDCAISRSPATPVIGFFIYIEGPCC